MNFYDLGEEKRELQLQIIALNTMFCFLSYSEVALRVAKRKIQIKMLVF